MTRVYLVRHGEAVSEGVDPKRPLSADGRAGVQRVAAALQAAGVRVARVVHSGKLRAQQTAEILAGTVLPGGTVEPTTGLGPLDPVEPVADLVRSWTEDAMLVGHLPFMDKLTSRLIVGRQAPSLVVFDPATVVALAKDEDDETWRIDWVVKPGMLSAKD
jgi:phosphohistidine phosphatase